MCPGLTLLAALGHLAEGNPGGHGAWGSTPPGGPQLGRGQRARGPLCRVSCAGARRLGLGSLRPPTPHGCASCGWGGEATSASRGSRSRNSLQGLQGRGRSPGVAKLGGRAGRRGAGGGGQLTAAVPCDSAPAPGAAPSLPRGFVQLKRPAAFPGPPLRPTQHSPRPTGYSGEVGHTLTLSKQRDPSG